MTAAAQATAVIAAAGSGERLGADVPKALVVLAGRPMAAWSVAAFAAAESVAGAVIAAPAGHLDELREVGAPLGARVVAGGAARSESVANALAEADADLVAIHDAARPLVTPDLIDALVARLAEDPAAAGVIAAAPILDTVKRAERQRRPDGPATVAATEDRDLLWAAQTPQVFRTDTLRSALDRAASGPEVTDEATLIERAGGRVLLHPSPATNLKVTTPEDLRIAGLLLGGV
jgi:2-C-methyl-D-erythritol 4-phosphate cytidylyltransferase